MDLSKYKELYLTEAHQQLAAMEKGVQALRDCPADAESLVVIGRAAHTLRGMSATMGYQQLAQLAGEVESLLETNTAQSLSGTDEFRDLLRDCIGAFNLLLQDVVDGGAREMELGVLLRRMEPYR
jgi:two-component system chemotaxis sensor kinase CheA